MPKVAKIKFDRRTNAMRNTTYAGDIEMDLYYHGKDNCFYVKCEDYPEIFPSRPYPNFNHCVSKDMCLEMIEQWLKGGENEKRFLSVSVTVGGNVRENRAQGVKIASSRGHLGATLGLEYSKVIRVSSQFTENTYFVDCEDTWERVPKSYGNYNSYHDTLIEWTQEREDYLKMMIDRIDKIATDLTTFIIFDNSEGLGKTLDAGIQRQIGLEHGVYQ